MKLTDKIRDRKIAYFFRKRPAIAFELALLYFTLAKRKHSRKKVVATCLKSIHWLKKAGIQVSKCLQLLSPFGQLEEIEKLLVAHKMLISPS